MTELSVPASGVPVPSDEDIEKLLASSNGSYFDGFRAAAAWGADQQLLRCLEWLDNSDRVTSIDSACYPEVSLRQRQEMAIAMQEAMRPRSPSLKQQALEAMETPNALKHAGQPIVWGFTKEAIEKIRRALEALPDDA